MVQANRTLVQLRTSLEAVNAVVEADRDDEYSPEDIDLSSMLASFNWQADGDASQLENKLLTELISLENTNLKAIIEGEERAGFIIKQLDSALVSLDKIEEWIVFYTSLLAEMGHEVHDIETQHKSMQITSKNQKVLYAELRNLTDTLNLLPEYVRSLRERPLDSVEDIQQCELATDRLLKLVTLKLDGFYENMIAVKERVALFSGYGSNFSQRLYNHLTLLFQETSDKQFSISKPSLKRDRPSLSPNDIIEKKLARYMKLLRFLNTVDVRKHTELQLSYVHSMARTYGKQFHEFIEQLKPYILRKLGEKPYIFSNQMPANVMALKSMKRMSTIDATPGKEKMSYFRKKKTLDTGMEEELDNMNANTYFNQTKGLVEGNPLITDDERMNISDSIIYSIDIVIPILIREQNFFIALFSLFTGVSEDDNNEDFKDVLITGSTSDKAVDEWIKSLSRMNDATIPIKISGKVQGSMSDAFTNLRDELCVFVESSLRTDPTFCVPVLYYIEAKIESFRKSSYTYLVTLMEYLFNRCSLLFEKFVESQIKAVEESKSSMKKRLELLPCILAFTSFVERIEKFKSNDKPLTNNLILKSYNLSLNCIFDLLSYISQSFNDGAKLDSDSLSSSGIYVENMAYLTDKLSILNISGLDANIKKCRHSYEYNFDAYCNGATSKILGKMFEFFAGVDELLISTAPNEVGYHIQYNKVALRSATKRFTALEVRKNIEVCYKRIERHFDGSLRKKIWKGVEETLIDRLTHIEKIISLCYSDAMIKFDITKDDIKTMFISNFAE